MKQEISVFDVKIIDQRTSWECGYRVLKEIEILINNDCDINRLNLFDCTDFLLFFPKIIEIKQP